LAKSNSESGLSALSVVSRPTLASYHAGKYTENPVIADRASECSAHESLKALSALAELVIPEASNRFEFLEECKSGRLDGVRIIYRTFASVNTTGRFDEELVSHLPASVKFVCHTGTFDTFIFRATLPSFSGNWELHVPICSKSECAGTQSMSRSAGAVGCSPQTYAARMPVPAGKACVCSMACTSCREFRSFVVGVQRCIRM
jgi:hypothetical protein